MFDWFDLDFADVADFDFSSDVPDFDFNRDLDLSDLEGGFEFPGYGGMTPGQVFEPASWGFTLRNLWEDYGAPFTQRRSGSTQGMTLADLIGRAAPGVAGAFAANQQADAYKDLSDKWLGFGAPSRARYDASYAPGFSMMNEPGYAQGLEHATRTAVNRHSVGTGHGGVAMSPNAMFGTLQDVYAGFTAPALQHYRNTNRDSGGYSVFNAAAPGTAAGAVDARSNIWNAAGAAAGDVLRPKRSLADLLAGR